MMSYVVPVKTGEVWVNGFVDFSLGQTFVQVQYVKVKEIPVGNVTYIHGDTCPYPVVYLTLQLVKVRVK